MLYGLLGDNVDMSELCLYEIDSNDLPTYNINFWPTNNMVSNYDILTSEEASNLASFLYHFYYFKLETNISSSIVEKIVSNSKVRMTSQFYLNSKSI
jgi:hypothetical protein